MTENRDKKNRLTFSDKFRKQMKLVTALVAIQAYNDKSTAQAPPSVENQEYDPSAIPDVVVRYTDDYRAAREALQHAYASDPGAPKPACIADVISSIAGLELELETSNAARLRAYRLALSDAAEESQKKGE